MVLRPRGRGRVGRRRHLVRPGRITDHRDAARSLFFMPMGADRSVGPARIPPGRLRCTRAGSAQRWPRSPSLAPQTPVLNNADVADLADSADPTCGQARVVPDCCFLGELQRPSTWRGSVDGGAVPPNQLSAESAKSAKSAEFKTGVCEASIA